MDEEVIPKAHALGRSPCCQPAIGHCCWLQAPGVSSLSEEKIRPNPGSQVGCRAWSQLGLHFGFKKDRISREYFPGIFRTEVKP